MMEDTQRGWRIHGTFYAHVGPQALLHGDLALIREVTGLSLDQFDRGDDPDLAEMGWMAVAFWHQNPELRRDQVVHFIEKLPTADTVERVGWTVAPAADGEGDDGPPAEAPEASSGSSSTTSDDSPEGETSLASASSAA